MGHHYVTQRIPATPQQDGKVQQVCDVCAHTEDVAVIEKPGKVKCDKADYIYDGKVKTPAVIAYDNSGKKLVKGVDYQVSYAKGRKNPGVYKVTVTFCGDYSGTVAETFTIRPKGTSLKKAAAKTRGFQLTWKKQASQTDGYQIQYSTSSKFKGKTAKMITAKKNTTAKKVSKLKANKKYYVRIRTFKTVKVNGKKRTLCSNWSAVKTVRTK